MSYSATWPDQQSRGEGVESPSRARLTELLDTALFPPSLTQVSCRACNFSSSPLSGRSAATDILADHFSAC